MNLNRLTILIFLIIFSLQSLTKADDIRDFQIEGMSIGDSALDFFSEEKIKSNKRNWYKDKKFYGVKIKIQSKNYDYIQLHFKTGDKKYLIHALGGLIDFNNNIEDCYPLKKKVDKELKNLFKNAKIYSNKKRKHSGDKSGKSFITDTFYNLEKGVIFTACYDLAKKYGTKNFRLIINTSEIDKWYGVAY
jgi:hypothetical protein